MSPGFPQRIRTLSIFHRALMFFCVPMFVLSAWATFSKFSDNAALFLTHGDVTRFWLNRITAFVACLGCLAMDVVILHLLFKRVTVTEEGVLFTGLMRRSVRWTDITEAKIVAERHTASLLLRSSTGRSYEIGIGDRNAADACQEIVAAISQRQHAVNQTPNQQPQQQRP
jgi:hypothetical protein